MLTAKKIELLLSTGNPVYVEFNGYVVEMEGVTRDNFSITYGDICPGMRGEVISILEEEVNIFEITLDLEKFYGHNYQVDPGDYLTQKGGRKVLRKWQDTYYYPENHIISLCTDFEIIEFKLLDESTNYLVEEFLSSELPMTYVQWLEGKVKELSSHSPK